MYGSEKVNVGRTSATPGQPEINTGSTYTVCWAITFKLVCFTEPLGCRSRVRVYDVMDDNEADVMSRVGMTS